MKVTIPFNWDPRGYQMPLWKYLQNGGKRAVACWHRRSGKDDTMMHWACYAAHKRIGNYWHMLPEKDHARKTIWTAINPKTGNLRIDDAFPNGLRSDTNQNEMMIRLKCGSSWQLMGSDNYDRNVGAAPIGITFSEWSVADPRAWAMLRPILAENDGWAAFLFTPRGNNHAKTTLDVAQQSAGWFWEIRKASETGVFTGEGLATELAELQREYGIEAGDELFQQEYNCSFTGVHVGAIYSKEMARARAEGRIREVRYDSRLPVHTFWDLGIRDATAIWFVQQKYQELNCIDYYEMTGEGLPHFIHTLQRKNYVYGNHWAPHDIEVRDWSGSGVSRLRVAKDLGISFKVAPNMSLEDGIASARLAFQNVYIDKDRCARGIECLENYHRPFDERLKVYKPSPIHDWSEHGASAFRYMAVSLRELAPQIKTRSNTFNAMIERAEQSQMAERRRRIG